MEGGVGVECGESMVPGKAVQVASRVFRIVGLVAASVILGGFFGMVATDTSGMRFMAGVGGLMGCFVGLLFSPALCWGLMRGSTLEGLFVVAVPTSIVAAVAGWVAGQFDLAILAALPTGIAYIGTSVWWGVRQRTTSRSLGLCARCDYDLSGNMSGVCPECGTPRTDAGRFQPHSGQPDEKSPSRL